MSHLLAKLLKNFYDSSLYKAFEPILMNICISITKRGAVPKHVVFVADGARRFGKKYQIPVQENHEIGLYGVMWQVIDWCVLLGIPEYSILMYSFGNYYRPKDEVGHWIVVLKIWLIKCIQNWSTLQRKGIRFNFYGKLKLIPPEINALMATLALITRNNEKLTVNMAMGYTGKHEMSSVALKLHSAVQRNKITSEEITEDLFMESLFAVENREADLLIRTSGYKRISDFLSWQTANGLIYFSNVLWPEFSMYHFIRAVLYYQHNARIIKRADEETHIGDQAMRFLKESKEESMFKLIKYAVELDILPNKNIAEIYSYDYEKVYHYFKLRYNLV